jgi:branched-chain amino acid aminotransferase
MLYIADEVFFTGTAAEITPIRSVDKIQIGAGKRGSITAKLQDEFFAIIEGRKPDKYKWLTFVE